jgi:MFS family permease
VPVLIAQLLTAAAMGLAAWIGVFPPFALFVWFVAIGLFTAVLSVLIAHGKSLFPPEMVGRGITLMNIGTMGGVFVSQTISGFIIDLFPMASGGYALDAYRAVFAFQAGVILLVSMVYFFSIDPRRNQRP